MRGGSPRFLAAAGWGAAARAAGRRRLVPALRPAAPATAAAGGADGRAAADEDVRPFVRLARHLRRPRLSARRRSSPPTTPPGCCCSRISATTPSPACWRPAPTSRALRARRRRADRPAPGMRRRAIPRRHCRPTTTTACSTRRVLFDRLVPAGGARPADAGRRARDDYRRRLARSRCRRRGAAPATLVLRDYHVDNLMRLPDRDGRAACGLLDFQDAVVGAAGLRSGLAARGRAPRRRPGLGARRCSARYLRRAPGARPARASIAAYAVLGAQRNAKIDRHLHPALRARRQARYLGPYPARLAAARARARPSRRWRRSRAWFDRARAAPTTRAAPCRNGARGGSIRRSRSAPRHGAGRRPRPAPAPAHATAAEAAGPGGGAHAARPRARRACRRRRRRRVVNTHYLGDMIDGPSGRTRSAPGRSHAVARRSSCSIPAAASPRAAAARRRAVLRRQRATSLWLDGAGSRRCSAWRRRWDRGRAWTRCCWWSRGRRAVGYDGAGDFLMADDGGCARRGPTTDRAVRVRRPADAAAAAVAPTRPTAPFSLNCSTTGPRGRPAVRHRP